MKFEEYFSFEAIVGDLIRWRVKSKGIANENGRRDVAKVLPARKAWSRARAKVRKGVDPDVVRRQSIWRTVMRECGSVGECCQCGNVASTNVASCQLRWVENLKRLVNDVQKAVFSGKVVFQKPRMIKIPKGYKNGVQEFRDVASFDSLVDRVILRRTTAYVRDVLEGVLGDCCYSFRRDSERSHQLAIARLQEWRKEQSAKPMYVAECDIRKFFDNISHDVVRRRWREVGFDAAAEKVLEAYLDVYETEPNRGLPQGGSFSTVLANLVLAAADDAVAKVDDGRLFYARYCDDVVFVHPDAEMCRRAMSAYECALSGLDLPMHPVQPFTYRPLDGMPTAYYEIKSKGPFQWRHPEAGEENCAPWVSFLGSQVRYDGETRIRKESIEKHIHALGRETAKAVAAIQKCEEAGLLKKHLPPAAAKVLRECFARFRNRLIAKGVGYVTAKVKDCHLCWAGAFTRVTDCAETRMQMRRLDHVREGMLCKVWRMLCGAVSYDKRTSRRYKGRPFSYYGFLEKATRPTNMAYRRRTCLPYSEL